MARQQQGFPLRLQVVSGVIWSLAQSWGVKLASFLIFAVLARVLGPADLGLYAAAMAVYGILCIFADQGLTDAVIQRETLSAGQLNTVFLVNLVLAVMLTALLWAAAPALSLAMKAADLTNVIRMIGLGLLVNATCFSQQAMHRRHFNFRWLALCSLASTLVSGLLGIALAWGGWGVWSLVWQTLAAAAINTALLWVRPQWKLSLQFDFQGVRPLAAYGLNRLVTSLLHYSNTRYIELVIAYTLGAAVLGLYAISARVYDSLMFALSAAVMPIAHSAFSRLAQDRKAMGEAYQATLTVTAAVVVPVFCFIAALSNEATLIVFGKQWQDSAPILRVLALMGAVQVMEYYNGVIFNAIGRPSIGLALVAFRTGLTVVVLWLAREQGLLVMAYGYALAQIAGTPVSFYLVHLCTGASMRAVAAKVCPFLCASVLATGVMIAMGQLGAVSQWPPFGRAVLLGLSGVVIYAGFVALTTGMRIADLRVSLKSLRKEA